MRYALWMSSAFHLSFNRYWLGSTVCRLKAGNEMKIGVQFKSLPSKNIQWWNETCSYPRDRAAGVLVPWCFCPDLRQGWEGGSHHQGLLEEKEPGKQVGCSAWLPEARVFPVSRECVLKWLQRAKGQVQTVGVWTVEGKKNLLPRGMRERWGMGRRAWGLTRSRKI